MFLESLMINPLIIGYWKCFQPKFIYIYISILWHGQGHSQVDLVRFGY
jgi:hypothetical protein